MLKTLKGLGALALALAVAAPAAAAQAGPSGGKFEVPKYPKLNPIQMPTVVKDTLPNGMKVILVEDHEFPVVNFRCLVGGGAVAEPADKRGLSDLFGEAHRTGGTEAMSGDEADEFLERMGASIEANMSDSYGSLSASTLTESLDKVLPLYADFLRKPSFAQEKVDLAKTHMRSAISRRNDDPMGIARREILKLIYGADSPYARQYEYDDVEGLTRDDLLAFHARYYRPDRAILAVWGDFRADEMKAKLAKAFGAWKAEGPAPEVPPPFVFPSEKTVNYVEKKDVEQTFIILGQLGMRLDDPDYPAVQMLSEILGGGFSSRIFVKVRTEKGLAYGAGGAMVPAYDHDGAFYFFTSTKPASTAEALGTILEEIDKIRAEPVSDAELTRAKEGYLNSYAFEFDSTGKIVNRILTYDFYGYPQDFNVKLRDAVEKVTKEDILRAAKTRLLPDKMTIVAIGKAEEFDRPLSTFGEVRTIDITIPEPTSKDDVPEATPEALARGKELMLGAAEAAGGKVILGLKDASSEGATKVKTPMGEMELGTKGVFVLPDRVWSELKTPMGNMVVVMDGDRGWMSMGPQSQDLPAGEMTDMRKGLWTELGGLLVYREALGGKLEAQALGKVDFEGKPAEGVALRLATGTLKVFLSEDGKTMLGSRQMAKTQKGLEEVTEVFSGWQVVGGIRVPFERVQKVKDEVASSSKLTSVKFNAGFSEDLFKRPPAAEPAK